MVRQKEIFEADDEEGMTGSPHLAVPLVSAAGSAELLAELVNGFGAEWAVDQLPTGTPPPIPHKCLI
jgi:hypothetical protein